MTVKEMIEILQAIEDQDALVVVPEHYTESRYIPAFSISLEDGEVVIN